jgi:hypothetical protein
MLRSAAHLNDVKAMLTGQDLDDPSDVLFDTEGGKTVNVRTQNLEWVQRPKLFIQDGSWDIKHDRWRCELDSDDSSEGKIGHNNGNCPSGQDGHGGVVR